MTEKQLDQFIQVAFGFLPQAVNGAYIAVNEINGWIKLITGKNKRPS